MLTVAPGPTKAFDLKSGEIWKWNQLGPPEIPSPPLGKRPKCHHLSQKPSKRHKGHAILFLQPSHSLPKGKDIKEVYQKCAIFWTNNQLHLSPVTFTPLAIFSSFEWISVDCPYGRLWPFQFTSVRCRIDTVPVSAPCRGLRCRWPVVSLCVNPLCPLLNLILLIYIYILISHVVDSCFLVQVASWQFARCSSMAPFHLSKDLTLTRFRIFRRQPFTPASSNTMQGYTQRIGCHMSQNGQPSN